VRDIRNTSTFRLTVAFGLVFAVGVTVLLGLIYVLSAQQLIHRSDRILRREVSMLAALPPDMLADGIRNQITHMPTRINFFGLRAADGTPIAGNIAANIRVPLNTSVEWDNHPGFDRPIQLLAVRTPSGETLIVARDISPLVDMRHRVLVILTGSGIFIAIIVLSCGIALSVEPLRRVQGFQEALSRIAAGDLRARMPLSRRRDELDLFAATVNQMIEELARAIVQVKGVTDAVAHDLRTPLTRVRSQLYRLRHSDAELGSIDSMVEAATDDLDMVLERFAALLRISELETGRRRAGFARVALAPLVTRVFELYEPLAEDRQIGIRLEADADGEVDGDEQLLFEAIGNLVDNAIKFSPEGGEILIRLANGSEGPRIEVRDNGPGIAPEEHQAVVRRFHRGANAADVPGTGLGLSLVLAIVHLHGFSLSLFDALPGLIASIYCSTNHPSGPVKFISLADSVRVEHL